MFGVDWNDSQTLFLNWANLLLGLVVVVCLGVFAYGVLQDILAARRARAAQSNLDSELNDLVSSMGAGAFHVPGVGLTMADGGEEDERKRK
jgi:hypothetical protein